MVFPQFMIVSSL